MATSEQRTCPSCSGANPSDAKFCARCGTALAAVCGTCGHGNAADASFCTECGGPLMTTSVSGFGSPQAYTPAALAEKIRAGSAKLEGERKQITVLYADVIGSTTMAERLDPEDMRAILQRSFDVMLEQIHRYEGTVSQFLGDGLLALFGAPIAHEDHAQRAARAALDIQAALEPYRRELAETRELDLRFRIGLHSGPVVVGHVGVDLSMDYLAVGDTMNMGARIQAAAPPGSVAASQATRELIEGYFVLRDLGELELKGKGRQHVYEVERSTGVRSRVDVGADRGLGPFVGRERELGTLNELLALADSGAGQVAFVSGDPGIGKSRLLYEFRRARGDEDAAWRIGRCISYGAEIPYLPIIDVVKDAYRIEETDDDERVARKLRDGVALAGADPSAVPLLEHLITSGNDEVAAMDPWLRKAATFEALRAVAVAAAARRPLVLTIEDAHWIDAPSTEFLSYLIDVVPQHRILLLVSHRTGWAQPFGDAAHFTHLGLRTLSQREATEVAEAVVGASGLPPELEELIFRKAEGNPFYVEEVTKALVETGAVRREDGHHVLARPIADVEVPDTVQGVIMARLDRLPEDPKRAIQTASVIGREFTLQLLERTAALPEDSAESVRELRSLDLIFERSLYPELVYMFKHALTHDVAYQSLLLERRKHLHGVVADAIHELYADRLTEQYETLAHHYERAERWADAVGFLVRSGDKATAAFAANEAISFYERALDVIARSGVEVAPEVLMHLHHALGEALFLVNAWERSVASFEALRAIALDERDERNVGEAWFRMSMTYLWWHRFEDGMACAEEAVAIGERLSDPVLRAGGLYSIGLIEFCTGRLAAGEAALNQMLELAREGEDPMLQSMSLEGLGELKHLRGDEAGGLALVTEASEIGRANGIPIAMLWPIWAQGIASCGAGRYDDALASLTEVLALAERLGEKAVWCRTTNSLGWLFGDLCNWERAIEWNATSLEEARAFGDPEIIRNAALNLADCYMATGRPAEAEPLLEEVERDSRQRGTWGEGWMKWRYSQHTDVSLGELRFAQGDLDAARGYAERCIEAAERTDSKRNVVKGRRLLAKVSAAAGDPDAADDEIRIALGVAREIGNPAQIRETLAVLGDLHDAAGRPEEARAARLEAVLVATDVADRLADPLIRGAFLASPQIAALRDTV